MQAELLRESLERSRELAAEADRRRIAGLACEHIYDSVRTSNNQIGLIRKD